MGRRHAGASTAADLGVAGEIAAVMQGLATPSRVRLLGRLSIAPATVTELVQGLGMEQSAISHQLRVLRELGLVIGDRDGRHVRYALHDPHVADLLAEAVSHTEHRRLGVRVHPTGLRRTA
jgi:DNA-binding transcriptional ArsR family regulator